MFYTATVHQPQIQQNRTISFIANDGTANSTAATKTITVTAVNNAPTLDAINDVTISANASAQTVNLTGITDGGDGGQILNRNSNIQ